MGCSLYEFENLCEAAYYQQIERAKRSIDMDLTPRLVYMPPIVAYFDFPRSKATAIISKWSSRYASEVSSYARSHSSYSSVSSSNSSDSSVHRRTPLDEMREWDDLVRRVRENERAEAARKKEEEEKKKARADADKLLIAEAEKIGYVDLGLSVVWGWLNIGADTVEESGLYYQWGDTVGYGSDVNDGKYFSWDDGRHELFLRSSYKWCKGSKDVLTKYNNDAYAGFLHKSDYKTILEEEDDAANVELGSKWRMPTYAEWNELIKKCTWVWTTLDGIKGYRVQSNIQGYTNNWIFLPAAGIRQKDKLNGHGNVGCYWSSSLSESFLHNAYSVYLKPSHYKMDEDCRCYGLSIRPVREVSKKDREEARKKQEERKRKEQEEKLCDSQIESRSTTRKNTTAKSTMPANVSIITNGTTVSTTVEGQPASGLRENLITYNDQVMISESAMPNNPRVVEDQVVTQTINWNALVDDDGKAIIPDLVTEIPDGAFEGCETLISVSIPNKVTKIGNNAFRGCCKLESINIPASVTEISPCLFKDCNKLISISIPDGVTVIDKYAFSGCRSLKTIVIPSSVKKINKGAFHLCTSLIDLVIPDSVTSLGEEAFRSCTALTNIVLSHRIKLICRWLFYNCTALKSVEIPDGVTKIGKEAFFHCISLSNVIIPASAKEIGEYAFSECKSLTDITIPDKVSTIGWRAFYACNDLKKIFTNYPNVLEGTVKKSVKVLPPI